MISSQSTIQESVKLDELSNFPFECASCERQQHSEKSDKSKSSQFINKLIHLPFINCCLRLLVMPSTVVDIVAVYGGQTYLKYALVIGTKSVSLHTRTEKKTTKTTKIWVEKKKKTSGHNLCSVSDASKRRKDKYRQTDENAMWFLIRSQGRFTIHNRNKKKSIVNRFDKAQMTIYPTPHRLRHFMLSQIRRSFIMRCKHPETKSNSNSFLFFFRSFENHKIY